MRIVGRRRNYTELEQQEEIYPGDQRTTAVATKAIYIYINMRKIKLFWQLCHFHIIIINIH